MKPLPLSEVGAYGLKSIDDVTDQALAYLDKFDRSQGFLDPSQSRHNQENYTNPTFHGRLDGQNRFKINVKINCNSFELIRGPSQVNLGPFESIDQVILSTCTSSRPKIVDSKVGRFGSIEYGPGPCPISPSHLDLRARFQQLVDPT